MDTLRVFAIFFVIFAHSAVDDMSHLYTCTQWLVAVRKTAVPVFFMISGAVLLGKDESITQLLKKRVLKFVCVIIIFYALQFFCDYLINGNSYSWRDCIETALTRKGVLGNAAQWFLYAYLGFLTMLPLLRAAVRGMTRSAVVYLLLLQIFIVGVVPSIICLLGLDIPYFWIMESFEPFSSNMSHWLFCAHTAYIFYGILGYFLHQFIKDRLISGKQGICVVVVALVCLGAQLAMVHASGGNEYFYTAFVAPLSVCIFVMTKWGMDAAAPSGKKEKLLSWAGRSVIVVFLIENLVRYMYGHGVQLPLAAAMPTYAAALYEVVVAFLTAMGIGMLLRCFPPLRRLF